MDFMRSFYEKMGHSGSGASIQIFNGGRFIKKGAAICADTVFPEVNNFANSSLARA